MNSVHGLAGILQLAAGSSRKEFRMKFRRSTLAMGVLSALLAACGSSNAPAPMSDVTNYVAGELPLRAPLQSDLAFAGTDLFVVTGVFGAGTESIVRRTHDGDQYTVVSGLNSVGGVYYDSTSGTLFFSDNAGDFPGAETGDTVYALKNALTAVETSARDLEILPSGSIPFATQLILQDEDTLLVTDAAGDGLGGVISVDLTSATSTLLIDGLDFAAGISILPDGNLLVGNVDPTYVGFILKYAPDGTPANDSGIFPVELSGAADQVLDARGQLIVTGGSAPDFSSYLVVSVDEEGAATTIADGFQFSLGIDMDAPSGQLGVVDSCYPDPCTSVALLTPTNRMTGLGDQPEDCQAAFWGGTPSRPRGNIWRCKDGDIACDRDRERNGSCTFEVGACLRVSDPVNASCTPEETEMATVTRTPRITAGGGFPAMQARVDEILGGNQAACSHSTIVEVSRDRQVEIAMEVLTMDGTTDKDLLKLRCR